MSTNPASLDPLQRFWNDSLEEADPEVAAIIGRELTRQRDRIELIASENIASPAVLEATGSVFTNKCGSRRPPLPQKSRPRAIPAAVTMAAATMPTRSSGWRSRVPSSCSAASSPTCSPTPAAR